MWLNAQEIENLATTGKPQLFVVFIFGIKLTNVHVPLIFIVMPQLNIYAIIQSKQQKDHNPANF